MGANFELLLLTDDQQTQRDVDEASNGSSSVGGKLTLCRDLDDLAELLATRGAPVALVDIDPSPMEALHALEPVVTRFPATRFVTLCREFRSEIVLEAMQVGARHCLVKESIGTDLAPVLERLGRDTGGGAAGRGRLVTVLASRGGCGATTVAVTLADELSRASGKRSLVIDLDAHYGAVASYLGVDGQFGVADVLSTRGGVDAELVSSTAAPYSDDLHVLLSPVSVNFGDPAALDYTGIERVLGACRQAYGGVVVDAARAAPDVAATLAKASTLTLIVLELTVIDVRSTRNLLQALVDRGVDRGRVLAVANRYRKRGSMLRVEDAEEALDGLEVVRVANDFPSATKAINYGKTLAEVAPRSPLRRDLQQLAERVRATATATRGPGKGAR